MIAPGHRTTVAAVPDSAPTAPTSTGRGRRPWMARLTWGRLGVAVVLAVLAANALAASPEGTDKHLGQIDLAAAVVGFALVAAAWRWRPREALALALAATVITVAVAERATGILAAVVLLLFRVAVVSERRQALVAGGATVAVIVMSLLLFADVGPTDPPVFASLAWPAAAVAVGDGVRTRRAYVAAVEERARRAEETREEEARRRVAEERLRIARDLHDLVAHRIAVVNVQAGLAAHLLRSNPDQAEEAMRVVRSSAGSVLDELGQMLSVLRQDGDSDAPTGPTPGLVEIGPLVASFADAGLDVTWTTGGTPRRVSDVTALAVYRTVQEGLTNAHKHGAGTARASLTFSPDGVEVTVDNAIPGTVPGDGTAGDPGRGGFGLTGMRERVSAAGGTLVAEPVGDRFQVRAWFPAAAGPEEGA